MSGTLDWGYKMILEILLLSAAVAGLTKKLEKSEKWNQIAKDFVGEFEDEEPPKETKTIEYRPFNPADYIHKLPDKKDFWDTYYGFKNNLPKWGTDNNFEEIEKKDEELQKISDSLKKMEIDKLMKPFKYEPFKYGPNSYFPVVNYAKTGDKIIEKKIDALKMVQAGEHNKKMERMHAEGRVMMSNHWAKMDRHMNMPYR